MDAPTFGPEVRSNVLAVLLKLMDCLANAADVTTFPVPLSEREAAALQLASDDDFALANACLELEHEIRCRELAAVEGVLAVLPLGGALGSGADLDARLRDLPPRRFAQAASGLYEACLVYPAPRD